MGDQIFSFIPDAGEERLWLWAGIGVFLLCGVLTAWLMLRQSGSLTQPRKALPAMLLFFAALLGAGSALFSGLSLSRLKPLEVGENGFAFGKKSYNWQEVKDLRLVQFQERNMLNLPSGSTRMLVIRLMDGRELFFSEASYPLNEVLGALRSVQPELLE